ncbi:hypothetical protein RP726_05905 [Candidatus Methylospira mobilis]|uniref:hypothetical protein n=1 Tax=Candidatus Methylospira mobilis TaxID=1808979 RepID=UPI001D17C7E9|nr:hypothetical protein [Candidatus Methylospira mobilis]WNV05947.1 hypothetical protein RP726_05905 [Candidatus Methylospira mobilis]
MTLERSHEYLLSLLKELVKLPAETEWVEFKHNNAPEGTCEYISALANAAALIGKQSAYEDRVRACYQHCCLKYVNREPMNNTSLRERLNIEEGNSAIASRVIKQTVESGLIRLYDPNANRKAYRYVPFWA